MPDATSERLLAALRAAGATVAVAESCTGGEVASALTRSVGASDCVWGGAVVYSAAAKIALAGVTEGELRRHGLVSAATSAALAEGIRRRSGTTLGLAVTGWAGPGADGPDPVGTVYLAVASADGTEVQRHEIPGSRDRVRAVATGLLLGMALGVLGSRDASGDASEEGT